MMTKDEFSARLTEVQNRIKQTLETRNALAVQVQQFDNKILKLQGAEAELRYLVEQEEKSGPESVRK